MKQYLSILLLMLAQSFCAHAMEIPLQKQELKETSDEMICAFDSWGFIKIDEKIGSILTLPIEQLCYLLNLQVQEDSEDFRKEQVKAASSITQVCQLWEINTQLKKDWLEGEDLLADLIFWMRESEGFKKILESSKKSDETYDLIAKASELKLEFEKYRKNAFLMESKAGSCRLAESVVAYFPFLAANKQFNNKMTFSVAYSKQTLITFKKLLYGFYNCSQLMAFKPAYADTNDFVGTGGLFPLIQKTCHRAYSRVNSDQLNDLMDILHFWDIKPLMQGLLTSLKYRDFTMMVLFINKIPLMYFTTLSTLMGSDTFIAHLLALKIDLCRKNPLYRLTKDDRKVIGDCLAAFAHYMHQLDEKMGLSRFMLSKEAEKFAEPFYKRLDLGMQNALKNLLLKRYVLPTLVDLNIRATGIDHGITWTDLSNAHLAERTSNYDFYFFKTDGAVRVYSDANVDSQNRLFQLSGAHGPSRCICRLTLGNRPHWLMTGDDKGVVRIYTTFGSENNKKHRITINPLPGWGAVDALCATKTSIIVAYQSGTIQTFDLKLFDAVSQEPEKKIMK